MALPAWTTPRTWKEPFRAIAIRGAARRLAAGLEPDRALWGGLLDATQHHCGFAVRPACHTMHRSNHGPNYISQPVKPRRPS